MPRSTNGGIRVEAFSDGSAAESESEIFDSGPIMIYFKDFVNLTQAAGVWEGTWAIQRYDADTETYVDLVRSSACYPQVFLNGDESLRLRIAIISNDNGDSGVYLVMVQNLTTSRFKGAI